MNVVVGGPYSLYPWPPAQRPFGESVDDAVPNYANNSETDYVAPTVQPVSHVAPFYTFSTHTVLYEFKGLTAV